jgi:polyisoprenoid-binding protein YceI
MTTAVQPFSGTYLTDPIHSSFGFAVKYAGAGTFRGTLDDVSATLTGRDAGLVLEGSARVESISIQNPPQFRAHVLGPEFFDSENHPAITFESTDWRFDGDELVVDGNLTIKGDTRPIEARGHLTPPSEDPWGNTRLGITLEAAVDRTHFGLNWNNPLPKGGLALANDVRLHVDLQLIQS